jgi:hypothetical protein
MWIIEAGTFHRWFSGACLMRSSGHILLNLLPISGSLNRSLIILKLVVCILLREDGHKTETCSGYSIKYSNQCCVRSLISWLLFCAVRFLWFFAYVLTTSVTYGMTKSLCKVTFDMYQGSLPSFLNVSDWNVWRIFVLEGLLHPHSSIP